MHLQSSAREAATTKSPEDISNESSSSPQAIEFETGRPLIEENHQKGSPEAQFKNLQAMFHTKYDTWGDNQVKEKMNAGFSAVNLNCNNFTDEVIRNLERGAYRFGYVLEISTSTFDSWIEKDYTLPNDTLNLFNQTILALSDEPLKTLEVSEGDPICQEIRYIRLYLWLRKAFNNIFESYYPNCELSYFTPEVLFSSELAWKICKNLVGLTNGLPLDAIYGGEPLPNTYLRLTEVMNTWRKSRNVWAVLDPTEEELEYHKKASQDHIDFTSQKGNSCRRVLTSS
ncbi:uncharacterized protein MELLADRAFT_106840 [Melampsora larici-populina 98AG31]|uniref:Uncharacterized protein n=1 Tax=Melampsora larici-populina (strain 98AG31 / pathotype 3-4-7) TaxID=747676 RepID=F4RMT4_MELLP|nr:uncharacterized protein MELLADRAFT_106840 [Melampsora larici-populina 98AG31]EGG06166.1 hypothetical protein MELLADRAFT_106840 [Melampsora larici-populina 98AG31]